MSWILQRFSSRVFFNIYTSITETCCCACSSWCRPFCAALTVMFIFLRTITVFCTLLASIASFCRSRQFVVLSLYCIVTTSSPSSPLCLKNNWITLLSITTNWSAQLIARMLVNSSTNFDCWCCWLYEPSWNCTLVTLMLVYSNVSVKCWWCYRWCWWLKYHQHHY